MKIIKAKPGDFIVAGQQGEEFARCVEFDIAEWERLYGPGTVQLLVKRMTDETFYPVSIEQEQGVAIWAVTVPETSVPGKYHTYELRYYAGETLAKAVGGRFSINEAFVGEEGEVPEVHQGWVEQIIATGAGSLAAQKAAEAARDEAEKAQAASEQAKDDAGELAKSAALSEKNATEAATRAEELSRQVGVSSGLQADLNENDPAATGYVHGRTHWVDFEGDVILSETEATVLNATNNLFKIEHGALGLVEGETYRVTYNGVDYDCVCKVMASNDGETMLSLGDAWYGKYPFILITDHRDANGNLIHDEIRIIANDGATNVIVSVKHGKDVVHPLPAVFLPDDATEFKLTSPDGTKFAISISNDGILNVSIVSE
jgi:hypothetical protein